MKNSHFVYERATIDLSSLIGRHFFDLETSVLFFEILNLSKLLQKLRLCQVIDISLRRHRVL